MKEELPELCSGPSPKDAAASLLKLSKLRPTLGLVLGTGFQSVWSRCTILLEVPFSAIPGFPRLSVSGHAGNFYLCLLAKTPLVVLSGRAHYYEGHSMRTVTFAVRVLGAMGIRSLLLTNAAGGINSRFKRGDFMQFSDHINFMGMNPLRGWTDGDGSRFVGFLHTY